MFALSLVRVRGYCGALMVYRDTDLEVHVLCTHQLYTKKRGQNILKTLGCVQKVPPHREEKVDQQRASARPELRNVDTTYGLR